MACPRCNGLLLDDSEDGLRCVNCGYRQNLQLLFLQHVFSSASPEAPPSRSNPPDRTSEHKRNIAKKRRRWLRDRSLVAYPLNDEPDGGTSLACEDATDEP